MPSRILLLEDDPSLAEVLVDALEQDGNTVRHFSNGLDAARAAAGERFDLAMLDVDVPELSGLGVERVLADLRNSAVVVMSGRMRENRRAALAAGAVACLTKPFGADSLLDVVRAIDATELQAPPWEGDVRRLSTADLERIARLSKEELDELPFGLMRVDRNGTVTAYNAFEGRAGRLEPSRVVGMKLVDLAPCLMVKSFLAAARNGWDGGHVDEVLRFVFPHHGAECVVSVRVYYDAPGDQLWLFVSKATTDSPNEKSRPPARPA